MAPSSRLIESAFFSPHSKLRQLLQGLRVDHPRLQRRLQPCRLQHCAGTCCHDGAYLQEEERKVLLQVTSDKADALHRLGMAPDQSVIVYGKSSHSSGPKTAIRARPMSQRVNDYPAHFPDTACVFLDEEARCALQRLAEEDGKAHWFYKPLTCWLHPLTLISSEREVVLTLHDEESDPQTHGNGSGFVPHTPCGNTCPTGEPAWKTLAQELRALSQFVGRDLYEECQLAAERL
ncbi:MAG: DUF3109 family protein [Verrucomicrobiota bacterium]